MYIHVDTDILLRPQEPTDPRHAVVGLAVNHLRAGGHDLTVAFQNLTEFWNVCTRPKKDNGYELGVVETERRLGNVDRAFNLLTESPAAYPKWRQLVVTHGVGGKQVHDARLVALMMAHGITHILTLNGPDFARYPGIVVLDPATVAPPSPVPPTS